MPAQKCPNCGAELKAEILGGLCPQCVLSKVLAEPEEAGPMSEDGKKPPVQRSSPHSHPKRVPYFGDYELMEEIACGAMGVVFKARQVSLNRLVALKLIRSGELARNAEVKRFHVEAEAAANLDHPNIVPIYEVGEHEGQHYFSMRLVDGASLAALQKIEGRDQKSAATLLAKVARAIHYAHQRGILHRDIKPGNILVDTQGEPHVTDFGLAKRVDVDSKVTLSGTMLGTPAYMPPEQVAARYGKLGPHSDVYSLGATLYHLLTGRPPFQGELADILRQVQNNDPVSPRILNPSVPRDLETICLKCLEKEAARRYTTAAELAEDLERWLQHKPIKARRASPFLRTNRWVQRNPWATGVIFSLCIGLATAVWLLLIIQQEKRDFEIAYVKLKEFSSAVHEDVTRDLESLWAKQEDSLRVSSLELDALFVPDLNRQDFRMYFPRNSPGSPAPLQLSLGVFAHEDPVQEAEGYAPLVKCLERDMSLFLRGPPVKVDLIFYRSEEQGRKDLIAGRVDFMRVGAMNYLLVWEGNTNVRPLVEHINPGKVAVFFTRPNSGIRTWKDMIGKKIVVGEPNSTTDVLALNILATNGITGTNIDYVFAGSHDEFDVLASNRSSLLTNAPGHAEVIQGVLTRQFDVGVTRLKYVTSVPGLVPIKGTEFECTRNLWVASGVLNRAVVNAFRQAMVTLPRYSWLDNLRDKPSGYRAVSDATYQRERQALQRVRLLFPVKGKLLAPAAPPAATNPTAPQP